MRMPLCLFIKPGWFRCSVQSKLSHFPHSHSPASLFLSLSLLTLLLFLRFWSISQRPTPQSLITCCWWGGLTKRRYSIETSLSLPGGGNGTLIKTDMFTFFSHTVLTSLYSTPSAVKTQPHLPSHALPPLFPPFPPFLRAYAPKHPVCTLFLPHVHTLKPSTLSSVVSPLPPKTVHMKRGRRSCEEACWTSERQTSVSVLKRCWKETCWICCLLRTRLSFSFLYVFSLLIF